MIRQRSLLCCCLMVFFLNCLPAYAYEYVTTPSSSCAACHTDYTNGTPWHRTHEVYATDCTDCHSNESVDIVPTSVCVDCHGSTTAERSCEWTVTHENVPVEPINGYTCFSCHTTCTASDPVIGDIQILSVTSNLVGNPAPGEVFTITVNASPSEGLQYRFFVRAGYDLISEGWGGNMWQSVQDWTAANSMGHSFAGPGNYYVIGHVVAVGDTWEAGDPQCGFNVVVK